MAEIRRFPLSPALQRAMALLSDPPSDPQVSHGYLDLLDATGEAGTQQNTGAIQRLWASPFGSMFYDNAQAVARRLLEAWQHPIDWLEIPAGGAGLGVGCGPGSITTSAAVQCPPSRAMARWRPVSSTGRRSLSTAGWCLAPEPDQMRIKYAMMTA